MPAYLERNAWRIVRDARVRARESRTVATPDTLLQVLLDAPTGRVADVLGLHGVSLPGPPQPRCRPDPLGPISREAQKVLREAFAEARRQGCPAARADHLLYALLAVSSGEAAGELRRRGLTAEWARQLSEGWRPPPFLDGEPSVPVIPGRVRRIPLGVQFAALLLLGQAGCCGCIGCGSLQFGQSQAVILLIVSVL